MKISDPIPDYYYTRSEDDFDFYYSNQDELDEAYDFFEMGKEDEIEYEIDQLTEEGKND